MARTDPYRNCRFVVEMDRIIEAGFREVTIPDSTQDPIEYREGGDEPTVRKIPGLRKYGNIVLKNGVTDSTKLWEWRKKVEDQKENYRKSVTIILIDEAGDQKERWEFRDAWPSKYDAPDLNATANEIAIETLEIVHEGMERKK